jgi:hypothetical protein
MTDPITKLGHAGLDALTGRPLLTSIWHRRTHRVSRGSSIDAGSMSWTSPEPRTPLTELEEAVLISLTGCTGLTMPDRPFADPRDHKPIMAKPNLNMAGRTAGSPDNAQGTHFFMINDSGTYFLRKLPPPEDAAASVFGPETLLARAEQAKVRLLDHRIDVPGGTGNRNFPAYLDSNRFPSNLPGTTIFFPVVDLRPAVHQRLMYLLTQPDGFRPAILDDRRFAARRGEEVDQVGFLNKDIKLPLGTLWCMRTQIEADLLLQNLMLTADAMGLGAWIHASLAPPVLLGDPKFRRQYGAMLGFDWSVPRWKPLDILRWQVILPWTSNIRATTVGLRHQGEYLIKAMCRTTPRWATPGRRGGREIRAAGHLRRQTVRAHLPWRIRRRLPGRPATTRGRDRARRHCTYIYPTGGPGTATRSMCRGSSPSRRKATTSSSSERATGASDDDRRWHPAYRHEGTLAPLSRRRLPGPRGAVRPTQWS